MQYLDSKARSNVSMQNLGLHSLPTLGVFTKPQSSSNHLADVVVAACLDLSKTEQIRRTPGGATDAYARLMNSVPGVHEGQPTPSGDLTLASDGVQNNSTRHLKPEAYTIFTPVTFTSAASFSRSR